MFEFAESEKNKHNQLLRYEFDFESYVDKYYDAVVKIKIILVDNDTPAYWWRAVNIKNGEFEWVPTWPPMSNEAQHYVERIYKLRVFF